MNNLAIICTPFSSEAAPPSLNVDLFNIKYNLNCEYSNIDVIDLDIKFYNYSKKVNDCYDLIFYLLGGFPFSFPINSYVPTNVYPFEVMPSGDFVLDLLLGCDFEESLKKISFQLNIDFNVALNSVKLFLQYLDDFVQDIQSYNIVIFSSNSITSCFISSYISSKLRKKSADLLIFGIGKNYFIPDIHNLFLEFKTIDKYFTNKIELYDFYNINANFSGFDFSEVVSDNYVSNLGLTNILLNCGTGCPNKCNFCSIRLQWDNHKIYDTYYEETNEIILKKIDSICANFGVCLIHFEQCTFNANVNKMKKLLHELTMRKALFSCNVTVKNLDSSIIEMMNKAHFYKVIMGVESTNTKMLKLMNKSLSHSNQYQDDVLTFKFLFEKLRISCQMNILLFYPGQTISEVNAVINDWSNFFKEIKSNNGIINNMPIGTLCINFPSTMYFSVLGDAQYEIVYHTASLNLKKTKMKNIINQYEKIPYYAIFGDKISQDNKMNYVKRLSSMKENNFLNDSENFLNAIVCFFDEVINQWYQNDLYVDLKKINAYNTRNDIFDLLLTFLNPRDNLIRIRDVIDSDMDIMSLSLLIIYLSFNNFCEFIGINDTKERNIT